MCQNLFCATNNFKDACERIALASLCSEHLPHRELLPSFETNGLLQTFVCSAIDVLHKTSVVFLENSHNLSCISFISFRTKLLTWWNVNHVSSTSFGAEWCNPPEMYNVRAGNELLKCIPVFPTDSTGVRRQNEAPEDGHVQWWESSVPGRHSPSEHEINGAYLKDIRAAPVTVLW